MTARILIFYGILGVICGMLLVLALNSTCKTLIKEGFQESQQKQPLPPRTCPQGSRSYTDKSGNLNCCRGEVNGNFCEGKVVCTFSSDAADKYKFCGAGRIRKYFGPINEFVKMYMANEYIVKFENIINIMEQFKPNIQQLVPKMVSPEAMKRYNDLIIEEKAWYKQMKLSEEDSEIYQEEVMYILNKLQSIFADEKVSQDPKFIQQQVIKEVCKK